MISGSMRALFAAAFMVAGLGLMSRPLSAENAEPEKCTCDALPEANQNNGAQILNATACWASQFDDLQWCDITVQSLEGDAGAHAAVVATLFGYQNGDDRAGIVNALLDEFEQFAATYQRAPRDVVSFDVNQARNIVPDLMKEYEDAIAACVSAFKEATFGKGGFQGQSDEDFRCRVGQSSGWLRIEFRVGEVWLAYMLAPNA
ncbi:hypothetical protein [Allomesorhizobium alhagi]|nr:hypothetical protein [Mesorhizobium alhagi]